MSKQGNRIQLWPTAVTIRVSLDGPYLERSGDQPGKEPKVGGRCIVLTCIGPGPALGSEITWSLAARPGALGDLGGAAQAPSSQFGAQASPPDGNAKTQSKSKSIDAFVPSCDPIFPILARHEQDDGPRQRLTSLGQSID